MSDRTPLITPRPPEGSNSPFSAKPLPPVGWWRRLRGGPWPEHAAIELENLLAQGGGGPADISRVLGRYRHDGLSVRRILRRMFARALMHCLSDDALTDDEVAFLADLKRRLDLSDNEVAEIQASIIHPRYQKALEEVMADRHISDTERAGLGQLQKGLRLPEEVRRRIHETVAGRVLRESLTDALRDRRLSPAEEADLKAMSENLGVRPPVTTGSAATMERFRLLWRIENGEIPEVAVDVQLDRDEHSYFAADCEWKVSRQSHLPAGEGDQVVKGVGFPVGRSARAVQRGESLTHVDTGMLYLTNKRLLFQGAASNRVIQLKKVVVYRVFSDAIVVEKGSGRNPYLFIKGDIELAAVILGAALQGV